MSWKATSKEIMARQLSASHFLVVRGRVEGVHYVPEAKKVISVAHDGNIIVWDMGVPREPVCLQCLDVISTYR